MPLTPATALISVLDSTLLVAGVTTLTVGGKVYTFVSGVPVGDQIQIGATDPLTAANIAIRVSTDTATTLALASAALDRLTLTANTPGTAGNSILLSTTAIPTAATVTAFSGGSDNTTYAAIVDLLPLVGNASSASDPLLQRILNSAARLFDQETRGQGGGHVLEGQEAYSESASSTRYFDDAPSSYCIEIDDLLTTAALARGDTALTVTTDYVLQPRNRGAGPYTSLDFSRVTSISRASSWYNYASWGIVRDGIAITGTWGYCTAANRPDAVKQAVLDLAAIMYKTEALTMTDVLNMISPRDPVGIMAANVERVVKAFKRRGVPAFV